LSIGVGDTFIQKILRHSNVSTTQRYYIKASAEDTQAAMRKLEAEIERKSAEIERLKLLQASYRQ
jgi:integrase